VLVGGTCLSLHFYPIMPTPQAYQYPFTAQSDLALLSEPKVLPRNINLVAFDPHRDSNEFSCRHAADHAPALTAKAQALHEQAMTLTSDLLWPNEQNWPLAMQLWQQAASMGHWKAGLMWLQHARTGVGINSEKGRFYVPPANPETVIKTTEDLMRKGVADAFFWMGDYYRNGYGLKRADADRAWAFWQLAADMGSAKAQTKIALTLELIRRNMEGQRDFKGMWANRPLMYKLLECAHAQGYAPASIELGRWLDLDAQHGRAVNADADAQFRRALQVLHDGVKFGSEEAANYLFSSFNDGDALVEHAKDPARARRYSTLGDALYNDPDRRFPNLDKVIPLPPAKLPQWDSNPQTLIDAAQGLRVTPKPVSLPSHGAKGRAHVPEGHAIFMPPNFTPRQFVGFNGIFSPPGVRMGIVHAPRSGYYQASSVFDQPLTPQKNGIDNYARQQALEGIRPLYYEAGEAMHLRGQVAQDFWFQDDSGHAGILWQFVGEAKKQYVPTDWLANRGTILPIASATGTFCGDGELCPQSGIWQPVVTVKDHALYKRFNAGFSSEGWRHQQFVQQGETLLTLTAKLGLPQVGTPDAAIRWRLMWACERGFALPEKA
jgi:TPR repeat protein